MELNINREVLLSNFKRYVELSDEEEKIILQNVTLRCFKKGQFISCVGEVDKFTNFIVQGSARVFYVDINGQEHNLHLGLKNWWISDYVSFTNQQLGDLFVEALEKTYLLSFSYEHLQQLYESVPKVERFSG